MGSFLLSLWLAVGLLWFVMMLKIRPRGRRDNMIDIPDHTHEAPNFWTTPEGRSAAAAFFGQEAYREEVRTAEAHAAEELARQTHAEHLRQTDVERARLAGVEKARAELSRRIVPESETADTGRERVIDLS